MLDSTTRRRWPARCSWSRACRPSTTGRPAALEVVEAPAEILDGFMATYRDAGGTTVYVLDQSTAQ